MLIDCSYFTVGSRRILNAAVGSKGTFPDANAIEVNAAIEAYISENQELFLMKMLGHSLGNKVHTYLISLDEGGQKRLEVFDALCERLSESYADYVFYRILRDSNSQATATGLVRLKCANEYVSPIRKQTAVWNNMVEKNRNFALWAASEECKLKGVSVSEEMITMINIFNL